MDVRMYVLMYTLSVHSLSTRVYMQYVCMYVCICSHTLSQYIIPAVTMSVCVNVHCPRTHLQSLPMCVSMCISVGFRVFPMLGCLSYAHVHMLNVLLSKC